MTIDEFHNVDLRVATVIAAERVEKSDKLLKLRLSLGIKEGVAGAVEGAEPQIEERQILSGIGKAYAPEDMVGRQVVIIANLDPRMMMGLESQGMLLAATNGDGLPMVLVPAGPVPPGTRVS
jgi:methionyl-tRNA synthetase